MEWSIEDRVKIMKALEEEHFTRHAVTKVFSDGSGDSVEFVQRTNLLTYDEVKNLVEFCEKHNLTFHIMIRDAVNTKVLFALYKKSE